MLSESVLGTFIVVKAHLAREDLGKWFDAELVEHYIEGLRKAGLDVQRADALVRLA